MVSDAIALQAVKKVQAAHIRALTTGEGRGLNTAGMAEIIAQEYAPVIEALEDLISVVKRAIIASGTDEEFAEIRVGKARAALAKSKGEPEPTGGAA